MQINGKLMEHIDIKWNLVQHSNAKFIIEQCLMEKLKVLYHSLAHKTYVSLIQGYYFLLEFWDSFILTSPFTDAKIHIYSCQWCHKWVRPSYAHIKNSNVLKYVQWGLYCVTYSLVVTSE